MTVAAPTLILASRSPRRAQMLREAGFDFVQADPPFDDPPQPDHADDPEALAIELASRKATSLRATNVLRIHPGGVILAADTICVTRDGRLIGQAPDRATAEAILRSFLGVEHHVVTGVAVLAANDVQPDAFADRATVVMHPISEHELQTYLDTQQWRGKAGAYNLTDRQQAGWVIDVHGDATTVVGLTLGRTLEALARHGVHPTHKPPPHHELFRA